MLIGIVGYSYKSVVRGKSRIRSWIYERLKCVGIMTWYWRLVLIIWLDLVIGIRLKYR